MHRFCHGKYIVRDKDNQHDSNAITAFQHIAARVMGKKRPLAENSVSWDELRSGR